MIRCQKQNFVRLYVRIAKNFQDSIDMIINYDGGLLVEKKEYYIRRNRLDRVLFRA